MTRKDDAPGADYSSQRVHDCIHEGDWGAWKEFKENTLVYRKSLCGKLNGIRNAILGLILAVLIPFIMGLISVGEIKGEIKRNSQDILKIDDRLRVVEHGRTVR